MECRALSGTIVGIEKGMHQAWQRINPSSTTRGVLPAKTTILPVRAVSTEKSPASVGRRARREQNVAGDFFVDRTCIDCDTCRWMAPSVYSRQGGQSAVHHQPASEEERMKALQALLACPTASIRTADPPKDIKDAHRSFPLPIDPALPGVYHCGYHSEKSFAATSYFVTRAEGNILVDSPRFSEQLAKRMEDLGGVRYMFLTHKDDVADHKKWHSRFNCERIIHTDEVTSGTTDVEIKLEGEGNWTLGSDVELVFTPGHTEGHVALYMKDRQVFFSGDHLGAKMDGSIRVDRRHNWYSVPMQIDSIEALLAYDFTWLLPGHGRRHKFASVQEKNDVLKAMVTMERTK